MAERKIEIRPKADDGTYPDIVYPKTTADMVVDEGTGQTVAEHLVDDEKHVPSGIIAMWSGTHESIPKGWNLCDGTNGTPDLRDRFIVGSGNKYSIGDTGGSDSVTLTESQIPSHSHGSGTLGTSSAGSHSHSFSGTTSTDGNHTHGLQLYATTSRENGKPQYGGSSTKGKAYTDSSGSHNHSVSGSTNSRGSHSHSISGTTSSTGGGNPHENRPPFYALAYIMKL